MPRTPAPLTASPSGSTWVIRDAEGHILADVYSSEADARAFVALPALEQALRSIANSSCCGCCQEAALVAKVALAQADGPASQQEK
jgi:hypothetical protein